MRTCLAVVVAILALAHAACQSPADDRELELGFLRAAVAPGLLPVAHLEVPALDHLATADVAGERALGLRVRDGQDLVNGGVRAELSIDHPFRPGDRVRYRWRFLIPEAFTADPGNRWWVLADWHDQPDRDRGETWDGFPSRSAPIIVGYGRIDGVDRIGISYGSPDPLPLASHPVARGIWHTLIADIAWSQGADGHAEFRIDGAAEPFAVGRGPNMHNGFQHYLKLGQYRHPGITGDCWVWLAGIGIETRAAAP